MKKVRQGQLLRSMDAKLFVKQHKAPCSDCPWTRKSLPGWLGPNSINTWIGAAHGEGFIACHTRAMTEEAATATLEANTVHLQCKGHWQCAGAAIYRANVCKTPRHPLVLQLPPDRVKVFSFHEFERHHGPAMLGMGLGNDMSLEEMEEEE